MTDPALHPQSDPHDREGSRARNGSGPGTPRWVKVLGIVVLVLVVMFVLLQVLGIGADHGPSRHSWPAEGPTLSMCPATEHTL